MTLKTKLLPHQREAYNKLRKIKIGALYMEMGTGKTRTALELIADRYNAGKVNHVLWLCPCSVRTTIRREIEKHTDSDTSMFTIMGIETLSSSIRANIECRRLVQSKNVYLIVDESNLVKNPKARRTQNIQRLADCCQYKLILNGTPVSRNEADMFAQWKILDWRILGYRSFWSFSRNHVVWDDNVRGKIKDIINVDYLTRKITPYTYQIRKEECFDLPSKRYKEYYYDITEEQRDCYNYAAEKLLLEIDEMRPHTIYRLFTGLQNVISGFHIWFDKKGNMRKNPLFEKPLDNPRTKLLLDIIEGFDDKCIIFCKYTHEINNVVQALNNKYGEGSALPFNGEIKQTKRQENLLTFEKKARFLVANKVTAGYGLNLQFCNNIIFYSNDWDYATRSQSEDRVHRLGQENDVVIIDIAAHETLDERILKCLDRKERLVDSFKSFIQQMKDKKDIKAMEDWLDGKEETDKHHQHEVRAKSELIYR